MSLQSILKPNNYDLFARSITASGDIIVGGDVKYKTLTQVSGTGHTNIDAFGNFSSGSGNVTINSSGGFISALGQITSTTGFFTPASLQANISVTTGVLNAVDVIASNDIVSTAGDIATDGVLLTSSGDILASGFIHANSNIISLSGQLVGNTIAISGSAFHVDLSGNVYANNLISASGFTSSGNLIIHGSITADGNIISLSGQLVGNTIAISGSAFNVNLSGNIFCSQLTSASGISCSGNIGAGGAISSEATISALGNIISNSGGIFGISLNSETFCQANGNVLSLSGQVRGNTIAISGSAFHVTLSGDVYCNQIISASGLTSSGNLIVHGSITADSNIVSLSGQLVGNTMAISGSAFNVNLSGDVFCKTLLSSSGSFSSNLNVNNNIISNSGALIIQNGGTFNLNIVSNSGNVTANAGTVTGLALVSNGNITSNLNIVSNSGNITASAGTITGLALVSSSTISAGSTITSVGSMTASGSVFSNGSVQINASGGNTLYLDTGSILFTGNPFPGFNTSSSGVFMQTNAQWRMPNLQTKYLFSLSGTAGNNYAFPFSGNTTLSGTHVLGQILNCNTSGGAFTLTLPNASVVTTLLTRVVNLASYWFDFTISNFGAGTNAVTLANSGDGKFTVNSTSTPANSSRTYKCVIIDPTAAATPSIVAY